MLTEQPLEVYKTNSVLWNYCTSETKYPYKNISYKSALNKGNGGYFRETIFWKLSGFSNLQHKQNAILLNS